MKVITSLLVQRPNYKFNFCYKDYLLIQLMEKRKRLNSILVDEGKTCDS